MRIKNTRIVSSANFKRELSRYLRETTAEDSPIFVTINGSGSHVLMHIDQYNHLLECENYIEEHGIKLHEEEKVKEENIGDDENDYGWRNLKNKIFSKFKRSDKE